MSNMGLNGALLALTIVVVGCGLLAEAEEVYDVDDFDPTEREQLEKLVPQLEKLDRILREKLEDQHPQIFEEPRKIIDAAERELSSGGCLGFCFTSKSRKLRDKVIELFVSLDQTPGRCDRESYNILKRNYVLHHALQFPPLDGYFTMKVLEHYQREHARHCRPVLKERFARAIEGVAAAESLERIERIFMTLTVHHFHLHRYPSMYHRFDLVGMRLPSFVHEYSRKAVGNIITLLKVEIGDQLKGRTVSAQELKPLLDEHLFEPCQNYRNLLGDILDEARFDAAAEDGEAQREFIYGDNKFHLALITNRMCDSMLRDREALYETLAKAWTR